MKRKVEIIGTQFYIQKIVMFPASQSFQNLRNLKISINKTSILSNKLRN